MEFLVIVLVIAIVFYWGADGATQTDKRIAATWQGWLEQRGLLDALPFLRLGVYLALPLFLVSWLECLLSDVLFGLPVLIFSLFVFFLAVGRGAYDESVAEYLEDWQRGDFQAAWNDVINAVGIERVNFVDSPTELHKSARLLLVKENFERFFPVIFWYFAGGLAGALGYRLVKWYQEKSQTDGYELQRVQLLLRVLEWPVLQLQVIAFALMGSFNEVMKVWPETLFKFKGNYEEQLLANGLAGLNLSPENIDNVVDEDRLKKFGADEINGLQSLSSRALGCWLAVAAIGYLIV